MNTFAKVWPEPDQTVNRTVLYIRDEVAEPPHFSQFHLRELRELVSESIPNRFCTNSPLHQFSTRSLFYPLRFYTTLE
ncbi:hypothetical protein PIB30_106688, partial [Stylosanthes scabra]|nr:hypothetical protein [Stylosanthes scabra]